MAESGDSIPPQMAITQMASGYGIFQCVYVLDIICSAFAQRARKRMRLARDRDGRTYLITIV